MNCVRCNGLAVRDDSISLHIGSPSKSHGWRCVNCGMISDDVIRHNQLSSPALGMSHPHGLRRHAGRPRLESPLRCVSR
jgi:hypothetical protein